MCMDPCWCGGLVGVPRDFAAAVFLLVGVFRGFLAARGWFWVSAGRFRCCCFGLSSGFSRLAAVVWGFSACLHCHSAIRFLGKAGHGRHLTFRLAWSCCAGLVPRLGFNLLWRPRVLSCGCWALSLPFLPACPDEDEMPATDGRTMLLMTRVLSLPSDHLRGRTMLLMTLVLSLPSSLDDDEDNASATGGRTLQPYP